MFDIIVVKETLKRELERVYKNLPSVVCDVPSLIWIIEKLQKEFKKDFEKQTEQGEKNE